MRPEGRELLPDKQGSRASCGDQEGRRGSEEVVPENLGVPLQGDRDAGELCGGASMNLRVFSPLQFFGKSLRRIRTNSLNVWF